MRHPKIIFRADASPTIGYGHFTRSLALAQMVGLRFETIFATRATTPYQQKEIYSVCNALWELPAEESLHYDAFIAKLSGDEIVVLDNYFFTTDYQQQIRRIGCKLVCIDDLHDKHYVADAVINDNIGQQIEAFSKEHYTRLYLGSEYALLRAPFLELMQNPIPVKRMDPEHLTILICFGGSDPNRLTLKYSLSLLKLPNLASLHIIVGDGYERSYLIDDSKVVYHSKLSAVQMSRLFTEVDFAVLPTSTITKEALACGTRVIGGYFADNQINNYQSLTRYNYIVGIGDLNGDNAIKRLVDGISDLRLIPAATNNCGANGIDVTHNIISIFTQLIS